MKKYMIAAILVSAAACVKAQDLTFDKIRVASHGEVNLVQGDRHTITMENGGSVPAGTYTLGGDGWIIINNTDDEEVIVTAPQITRIEISGTGELNSDRFNTSAVELMVTGIGSIEMNALTASNVHAVISGAGKIELEGSADEMKIDISGAGKIDVEDFVVKRCVANISGSGKSLVNVTEELTSNISGSGNVYYVNPPAKINNNISGVGRVGDANATTKDTTRIMLGKRKILIIDGDDESVRVSFKDTVKNYKEKKVNSHWAGIELGINTLMNEDNKAELPPGYNYLELRESKSIAVNFNVIDYQVKLYKRYVMLVSGLGFSYNNYRFRSDSYLAPNASTVSAITDSSISLKKNKLVASYLNIPLLIEFNTSTDPKKTFHFAAGVIGGLRIGSHLKLVEEQGNKESKNKIYDDFNLNPFKYDATVRIGYRNFAVFAQYGLAGLFKDKKGPDLNTFTVGLRVIGW